MAGHAFVIRQSRHSPLRHFRHVAQVRVENSRPGAIHRRALVVGARSGRLFEFRHAPHFHLRFRKGREKLLRTLQRLVDQARVFRQRGGAAGVVIRKQKSRIFSERVQSSADRLTGKTVRIQNVAHLAFDPRDFGNAELMDLHGV